MPLLRFSQARFFLRRCGRDFSSSRCRSFKGLPRRTAWRLWIGGPTSHSALRILRYGFRNEPSSMTTGQIIVKLGDRQSHWRCIRQLFDGRQHAWASLPNIFFSQAAIYASQMMAIGPHMRITCDIRPVEHQPFTFLNARCFRATRSHDRASLNTGQLFQFRQEPPSVKS